MLVYEAFRWFSQRRRGSIERQRQRACLVVVAFLWAILVGSGGLAAINHALGTVVHTPVHATYVAVPLQGR